LREIAHGGHLHLNKPVKAKELTDLIQSHLAESRLSAPASTRKLAELSPEALVPPEIWAAMHAEIAQDRDDPEALAAVEKRIRELLSKEGSRH
jgi:hypothetical protein